MSDLINMFFIDFRKEEKMLNKIIRIKKLFKYIF